MTDAGSEFRTERGTSKRTFREVGASERLDEQWRIAVERSLRVSTQRLMRWLRYRAHAVISVVDFPHFCY